MSFFEHAAAFVDRAEEQPVQDLPVRDCARLDARGLLLITDHLRHHGIGVRRPVALLVTIPAGARLLAQAAQRDQALGDRQRRAARVGGRAPCLQRLRDVEPREVARGKRPHRVTEIDQHAVDLLGSAPLEQHHLGVSGARLRPVKPSQVRATTQVLPAAGQPHSRGSVAGAVREPTTTSAAS
jgi:hypothetical protein